jgi:hypothetical protein
VDGLRKAALLLSSLRAEDRAWMLARVHDSERAQLVALLSEVHGLGVSLDAQTLRQLARSDSAEPEPETDVARSSNVASASAGAMHEVLGREPDWLIAIVLRDRPWRWREAFLNLLGTERRMRVQRVLPPGIDVRPRVIEALISAIEARLDEQAAGGWQEPESPRRMRRLSDAVGGLFARRGPRWRK